MSTNLTVPYAFFLVDDSSRQFDPLIVTLVVLRKDPLIAASCLYETFYWLASVSSRAALEHQ